MRFKFVLFSAFSATLVGCHSVKTKTSYDRTYDFSTPRTYQWVQTTNAIPQETRMESIFLNRIIQKTVDTEMKKRGFLIGEKDVAPDLQTDYTLKMEAGSDTSAPFPEDESSFNAGVVFGKNGWTYKTHEPETIHYGYEKVSLTVFLTETRTGRRVWMGDLQIKLSNSLNEQEKEAKISGAIKKMFQRYPSRKLQTL